MAISSGTGQQIFASRHCHAVPSDIIDGIICFTMADNVRLSRFVIIKNCAPGNEKQMGRLYLKDQLWFCQVQHRILHSWQDASLDIQGPDGFVNWRAHVFDLSVLEWEQKRLVFQSSGKISRTVRDRSRWSIPWIWLLQVDSFELRI